MKLIDWLLKKSNHHRSLVIDHKEHKKKTRDSFRKVKRDNMLIVQKLKHHEDRIKNLEKQISEAEPMRIYRKGK